MPTSALLIGGVPHDQPVLTSWDILTRVVGHPAPGDPGVGELGAETVEPG